jgi:hypothetical protein
MDHRVKPGGDEGGGAVADEERCAAPSSTSFDPADAADGFRSRQFVVKMSR